MYAVLGYAAHLVEDEGAATMALIVVIDGPDGLAGCVLSTSNVHGNPDQAISRVRDARRDFLHKTSTRLVRDNDLVAVEDLNVSGMVRNRALAKSISDVGWGEFRTMLAYKTGQAGKRLVIIDRWYPSTKTCSVCGHLLATISLGTRYWTCPDCGTRHDRDINAAKNILVAAGLAETRNACRADVRLQGTSLQRSAVKQETPYASAGIPVL